ncbi:hypothetical protein GIB67_021535 [Kingdonia uniflora]|uniref:Beta-galactosidase n=1 Tax=Kingdonia uniflora TaxID=39325 RepID=A0A7J7L9L3_9MAGN|nr:hypothetical protein GIB67_021535 [Kingdonia uniflora]
MMQLTIFFALDSRLTFYVYDDIMDLVCVVWFQMWPDLIQKAKDGGLDTIETCVFWNAHEPHRREYDFSGNLDIIRFLKTIKSAGMYAVLRIGPYVCAKWNYGGFPMWLHNMLGIKLRTDNEIYKNEMQNFTTKKVDMARQEKLFASLGGPIILAQIENEYGNFISAYGGAGKSYINWCASMAQSLDIGVPLILATGCPNSLKMWTENWTGWFKHWGGRDPHRTAEDLAFAVARFFQFGGTFQNYYMYHGGTNFGRTAGGSYIFTSYDYDAPLDEYGNLNQPKWGHLKQLQNHLKSMEKTLTYGDISTTNFKDSVTVHPQLYDSFIATIDKGSIKTMQNRSMPADPHPTPGAQLMGDAFNMRHHLIGGSMTVALSDIAVLHNLLKPLRDLNDASSLCRYLESFYILRKACHAPCPLHSVLLPAYPARCHENKFAWRTDEEFGREMLAGVNPVAISLLQEFPLSSKLDPKVYGNQRSSITKEHLEKNLNGLTVTEALRKNKIFILDHHDTLMPLPHPKGEALGAVNKVFTPAGKGVEGSVYGSLQKLMQLLNTHAVIEPFVIATNRQLSVLHPIHKLLHPHFRDTMNINALARQIFIYAGGVLENTVFPAKFSMELSSVVYKEWVFTEQELPVDLIQRGLAVADSSQPHGLCLLIEDYPYAVDGLEIWSAIHTWVHEYCSFYYPKDNLTQGEELQSWWAELRDVGHGDKKDEPWWPKMQTLSELTETCTIIIWVVSALHAAVNFGQYPYAGYLPNRPTISRCFMPERGTPPEYTELESNSEGAFLKTITSQFQTLLGISLIEILSRHFINEVYLGQRDTPDWTLDVVPLAAFKRFGEKLVNIENRIVEMNNNKLWKNCVGPVKVPYTLLYPNTSDHTCVGGLLAAESPTVSI